MNLVARNADAIVELGQLLREVGLRVIFDRHADCTRDCENCGRSGPSLLPVVGAHVSPGFRGAPLRRPLCARCAALLGVAE